MSATRWADWVARNLTESSNTLMDKICSLPLWLGSCCHMTPLLFSFLFCRLAKEEVLYIKEAKQQEEKIERLKAEAGDEYVIRKQVNIKSAN